MDHKLLPAHGEELHIDESKLKDVLKEILLLQQDASWRVAPEIIYDNA